jgi:hypothetical protein
VVNSATTWLNLGRPKQSTRESRSCFFDLGMTHIGLLL